MSTRLTAPALLALLAACKGDKVEDTDPAAQAAGIDSIALAPVTEFPTVVRVSWDSPEAGQSWVQYGLDGEVDQATPEVDDGGALSHTMTVLGLKAGRSYSFQAFTRLEDGTVLQSAREALTLESAPSGLPDVELSDVDEAQMQPGGFILLSVLQSKDTWVLILDRDADPVWYHKVEDRLAATTTKIGLDHQSVLVVQSDRAQVSDLGGVQRLSLDGETQVLTRNLLGHHDVAELPDGDLAWPALDIRDGEIDGEEALIAGDLIYEAPEGATDADTPTTRFSFWDDYRDPWLVCIHMNIEIYGTGALDWTHGNSLIYEPDSDSFYMMTRNLDALHKIDRQTGEIQWQLGGLYSDFTPTTSAATWSHGHVSDVWDGGMILFDNGYHYEPQQSRILEIAWDEDAKTYEETWSFQEGDDLFVPLLGDARRLPNGNVLASWTSAGMLTEITRDGAVVWRLEGAVGNAFGRIHYMSSLYTME